METVDEVEFDGTLITGSNGSCLSVQRFGPSADVWIKEPCGVQFRNTNKRSDIIVKDNVDVKSTCDTIINQEIWGMYRRPT